MAIELGPRARAAARRVGHPWLEGEDLHLGPGPQLLTDWRYVLPGEVGMGGTHWAQPDGTPMPLRLWDDPDWRDRHFEARYIAGDAPTGIRIVAMEAEREGPFPLGEPPGRRIIHHDGLYQTWYSRGEGEASRPVWCAESRDGYEYGAKRECTFDFGAAPDVAGNERSEIFLDPVAPEEERYKLIFRAGVPGGLETKRRLVEAYALQRPDDVYLPGNDLRRLSGMWGATSPDGVRWKVLPEPLVLHYSDTTNVACYDERLGCYVWYARCSAFGRRSIGRAETDDFRRWPLPEPIVCPGLQDHPADDWYTNSKTMYPGSVDHHLMFPALFHHADDTADLHLFSSADGITWSRVPGPSALSCGEADSWDAGCVFGGTALIPLGADRVGLPYGGYPHPHKYPRNRHTFRHDLGYAVWPAERLAALEVEQDGHFLTMPMTAGGRRLRLNAAIKSAGHILVEVADRRGQALPGHTFADAVPVLGDSHSHRVSWRNGDQLPVEPGQSFALRFRLRCARLFAFQVD